ncbi:MAG: hypothetical protein ACOC4L_03680 [Halanaerobium sp.]
MKESTIRGLLKGTKREAIIECTKGKLFEDQMGLDKPMINQSLNDMLDSIYKELIEAHDKEKISTEEFEHLKDYAENYTCNLQV